MCAGADHPAADHAAADHAAGAAASACPTASADQPPHAHPVPDRRDRAGGHAGAVRDAADRHADAGQPDAGVRRGGAADPRIGNEIANAVTLFLGLAIGATMVGAEFLKPSTLAILVLGIFAFALERRRRRAVRQGAERGQRRPLQPADRCGRHQRVSDGGARGPAGGARGGLRELPADARDGRQRGRAGRQRGGRGRAAGADGCGGAVRRAGVACAGTGSRAVEPRPMPAAHHQA